MQRSSKSTPPILSELISQVFGAHIEPLKIGYIDGRTSLSGIELDNFDLFQIESTVENNTTAENEVFQLLAKCQPVASWNAKGIHYLLRCSQNFNRYARGVAPKVISFYTKNTPYEKCAEKLRYSLLRCGYSDFEIVGIEDTGSWEVNCSLKPHFILQQLLKHKQPVLWVDADAQVMYPPIIPAGVDFAVNLFDGWEFASGTIFFNYNDSAITLLKFWSSLCKIKPLIWDQMLLDEAWAKISKVMPLTTLWLPEGYTYIYDNPKGKSKESASIIHFQQSRESSNKMKKPTVPDELKIARQQGRPDCASFPDIVGEPSRHSVMEVNTVRWPTLNLKLEFLLEQLYRIRTQEKTNIHFVQVGAMDGLRFDPIFQHVKNQEWEGILIEPLSDMFSILKDNYKRHERLTFVNAAIDTSSGEREINRIPPGVVADGILPEWALGISSFYNDRNALGGKQVDDVTKKLIIEHTIKEKVTCITFEDLLDIYPAMLKTDVLLIDTEGHDFKVLKAFPFHKVKPLIIEFEYYNLPPSEFSQALRLIEKHGYAYTMNNKDVTASLMRFSR